MTRPEAIGFAREHFGAMTAPDIAEHLTCHGVPVSRQTVARWADSGWEDRRIRDRDLARERRRARKLHARMLTLKAAGLSFADVARVITIDTGIEVDADQVAYMLEAGRISRPIQARLAA